MGKKELNYINNEKLKRIKKLYFQKDSYIKRIFDSLEMKRKKDSEIYKKSKAEKKERDKCKKGYIENFQKENGEKPGFTFPRAERFINLR